MLYVWRIEYVSDGSVSSLNNYFLAPPFSPTGGDGLIVTLKDSLTGEIIRLENKLNIAFRYELELLKPYGYLTDMFVHTKRYGYSGAVLVAIDDLSVSFLSFVDKVVFTPTESVIYQSDVNCCDVVMFDSENTIVKPITHEKDKNVYTLFKVAYSTKDCWFGDSLELRTYKGIWTIRLNSPDKVRALFAKAALINYSTLWG